MYSKTQTGKASKGSVSILVSNGRLQLRLRYAGKRLYTSLEFSDTPQNRKLAEMKAREIELDILSGQGTLINLWQSINPTLLSLLSLPTLHPKLHPRFRIYGSNTPITSLQVLRKPLGITTQAFPDCFNDWEMSP